MTAIEPPSAESEADSTSPTEPSTDGSTTQRSTKSSSTTQRPTTQRPTTQRSTKSSSATPDRDNQPDASATAETERGTQADKSRRPAEIDSPDEISSANSTNGSGKIDSTTGTGEDLNPSDAVGVRSPSGPSRGGRLLRFFKRLLAAVVVVGVAIMAVAFGWPWFEDRLIDPLDANSADIGSIEGRLDATEAASEANDARLDATAEELAELDIRQSDAMSEFEADLSALTTEQARTAAQLDDLTVLTEAELGLLALDLDRGLAVDHLARARLFLYQSNFGLADADIESARQVLIDLEPEDPARATSLLQVIDRLDEASAALPDQPVLANDHLNIAWQVLISSDGAAIPGAVVPNSERADPDSSLDSTSPGADADADGNGLDSGGGAAETGVEDDAGGTLTVEPAGTSEADPGPDTTSASG